MESDKIYRELKGLAVIICRILSTSIYDERETEWFVVKAEYGSIVYFFLLPLILASNLQ
jgi:hypothetical protein